MFEALICISGFFLAGSGLMAAVPPDLLLMEFLELLDLWDNLEEESLLFMLVIDSNDLLSYSLEYRLFCELIL